MAMNKLVFMFVLVLPVPLTFGCFNKAAKKTSTNIERCTNGCYFNKVCVPANKSCCPLELRCPTDCKCGITQSGTDSNGCPILGCLDVCSGVRCKTPGAQCTYELFRQKFANTALCRSVTNGCEKVRCTGGTRCYYNSTVPSVQCVAYNPCQDNYDYCNENSYCDYKRPDSIWAIDSFTPPTQPECFPKGTNPCDRVTCGKKKCFVTDGSSRRPAAPCQNFTCKYPKTICSTPDHACALADYICKTNSCIMKPMRVCDDEYCPYECRLIE